MAYNVSTAFREQCYSGESLYTCRLIIGGETIPTEQLSSITISSPIIDTSSEIFYIGTFISQKLTIQFKNLNGINTTSGTNVELYISQNVNGVWEEVPIGKYLIDESPENYYKSAQIECLDYAIKFATNLDYSPAFVDGKITIDDLLQWICNHYGVTLGNYPNTNGDIEIATYDSTISGKRWISYIAELKGCNAKMDRYGRLILVPLKQQPVVTIDATKGGALELGEKYFIQQVTYFDATRNYTFQESDINVNYEGNALYYNGNRIKYTAPQGTGNILIIRQDNPFILNAEVVENIYNVVKRFTIWSLKTENYGDISLDAWDIINYQVDGKDYYTYNNNTITYAMTIMSKVETKIPTKQQEITTNVVEGTEQQRYRRLGAEVNSLNAQIQIFAEENRVISDTKVGYNQVQLVNAYEGTLHYLSIKGQMSLLYPSDDLYPSNTLYPLDSYLSVDGVDQVRLDINYLNYISPKVCDEFIYEDGKCKIIRRVGVDNNGNLYPLTQEITEERADVIIKVKNNSILKLTSFHNLIYSTLYLLQNNFTDTFAPTMDLISKINISPEQIQIQSNKLKLEGYTTINDNFGVDLEGNMWAKNGKFSGSIYLENGGEVIGGNGLMTYLRFDNEEGVVGNFNSVGFFYNYDEVEGTEEGWDYKNMVLDYFIPKDFTIEHAYLTLETTPVFGDDDITGEQFTGYCKQLKVYSLEGQTGYKFYFASYIQVVQQSSSLTNEIINCFGTSSYTPQNPVLGSIESVASVDIKDYLLKGKGGTLILKTNVSKPTHGVEPDGTIHNREAGENTGMARMTLHVYGYMPFEGEESE